MSLPKQVKNLFGKQLLLLWFKLVSYHSINGPYCHIFKTCNANITTGRSECHALRGIYVQRTSQRCQPQVLPWRGPQVFGFNRPTKMCSIRTYKMKNTLTKWVNNSRCSSGIGNWIILQLFCRILCLTVKSLWLFFTQMWSLFQNIPLQCYTCRLLLELLITMKTLQLHYLQGQGCGGEG